MSRSLYVVLVGRPDGEVETIVASDPEDVLKDAIRYEIDTFRPTSSIGDTYLPVTRGKYFLKPREAVLLKCGYVDVHPIAIKWAMDTEDPELVAETATYRSSL